MSSRRTPQARRRAAAGAVAVVGVSGLLAACAGSAEPAVPQYTVGGDGSQPPSLAPDQVLGARRAAGIADCPRTAAASRPVDGGLPALELECLGGDSTVNLASLPRGKPWVVNVWAQWCGPCEAEAPFLAQGAKDYAGRVDFLGINYDDRWPHKAIAFADRNRLTFPQVVDQDKTARVPLRIVAVPQTFFVDAQGRVVHRELEPFTSTAQFDALVSEHLGVEK